MIKACFIVKYPPIEGGVSKRGYWTARELAERGNQVFVVTNANEVEDEYRILMDEDDGDWYQPHFETTGGFVKVRRTQPLSKAMMHIPQSNPFITKLSSVAAQVIRKNGCEVIFADYLEPYGFAAYLASQWTGVPYVVKHAGSDVGRLMKQRDMVTAYREVLKAADCVWSGLGADPFLAIGVKEENLWTNSEIPLPPIFNPHDPPMDLNAFLGNLAQLDSDHVRNVIINTSPISFAKPVIGIYGKAGEVKGSFDLVAALGLLKRRGLDFNFVALTQGRALDTFKAAIREQGLQDRTWMLPFIPHWKVPGFLRACTAVCFLERDFPIAFHGPQIAKEVFACGTCLVLSAEIADKQPAKRRLADGVNVLIVDDPKDHEDLARQLSRVITEPARAKEIGLEGHKFYVESQTRTRNAPRTYIERLEEKLIEVRDRRTSRYAAPLEKVDSPEDLKGKRLKKRLPGTSAFLNGEWDKLVSQYVETRGDLPDDQFKDAVAFCDFLGRRLAQFNGRSEYLPLADVLKYERTRNSLLTDLDRDPSTRSEGLAEREPVLRSQGSARKTFEQLRSIKFVKSRGVHIESFDYDLANLMKCLRQGETPRDLTKAKTFIVFKKELVLETDADVAAERQRRHRERPLIAADADHFPARAGRHLLGLECEVARARRNPADDAHDEREVIRRLRAAPCRRARDASWCDRRRSTPSRA